MGYIRPDLEAVDGDVCIQLRIPNNPEILRAVWGQLDWLGNAWAWDDDDGRTPETDAERIAIAEFMRNVLYNNRVANIEYECPPEEEPEDDAPYWEDLETVAGAGENWGYEEIADWAITAFLAVAGSPLAALYYRTAAPKARLAFQTFDAGAIVNVFIDSILAFAIPTASTIPGQTEIVEATVDLVQFAADNSLTGLIREIRLVAA
jgi:hypothetical protein